MFNARNCSRDHLINEAARVSNHPIDLRETLTDALAVELEDAEDDYTTLEEANEKLSDKIDDMESDKQRFESDMTDLLMSVMDLLAEHKTLADCIETTEQIDGILTTIVNDERLSSRIYQS